MMKTSVVTREKQRDKHSYLDRYEKLKANAIQNWPDWKISEYNENIAISVHAEKLKKRKA